MSSPFPSAVLWDMDGTLVDSEPYWIAEERALVESYGGTWTHADALALVGNPLIVSATYIVQRAGVPLTPVEVVERLVAGVGARLRQQVPWRPGVRELLAELNEAGVPCALVTMSYRVLTDLLVAALPEGALQVVVSGDEVTHGKPHPEPYLTAAARLGIDPGAAVAIEDSEAGARSAAAAGVAVIVVPNVKAVPPIPGTVQVPTLAGVGAADLLTAVAGVCVPG
jgi:HAD superfamily hydrolase (TIGR01509 family)